MGVMAAAAVASGTADARETDEKAAPQRFLLVGLCGSENPTRSNFPFVWAAALRESGQEVRIELAGDATVMMRTTVANNVTAVGWPPFREALAKVVDHKIPIYV
jgi:predicted peroxiredoxin